MASSQVAKQGGQQVSKHDTQDGYEIESREKSASASASAGLNLNVFGAVAGMFGSKSRKETAADGSSIEQREERAHVRGAGAANMKAAGQAQAQAREAEFKHIPIGDDSGKLEDAPERKKIQGT